MSKIAHVVYITAMVVVVIVVTAMLTYKGASYYNTGLAERFYHPGYQQLKPSGSVGHGLGIIGSLLIFIGVVGYMMRKRMRAMAHWGVLKYWLEFHIFLCTLGPILVLFHTSFKFGGLVSISFWSMVAVFASGVIGRFIYIQIPRTIEGRELSLNEVKGLKSDIGKIIREKYNLNKESYRVIVESTQKRAEIFHKNTFVLYIKKYFNDRQNLHRIKAVLRQNKLDRTQSKKIIRLVNNEIALNRKINRLTTMQNLFKYWHVAHLPFAIILLVIMTIHVIVTLVFGYRWIF